MGIWRWLAHCFRRPIQSPKPIILYTRKGCHLCDEAWQVLEDARKKWAFEVTVVDVDGDPALVAEHGESVPVVAIDGKVRFRGRVNAVLLSRLLSASLGEPGA